MFDINACNNNLSNNNKWEGRITSRLGMISIDFMFFFNVSGFSVISLCFWFFLGYYTTFYLVSCISLSVFGHIPFFVGYFQHRVDETVTVLGYRPESSG